MHDTDKRYGFKTKGESHAVTKVTKVQTPEELEADKIKIETAEKVTPGWRLEQMYDLANDVLNGGMPSIKNMSKFLKMINHDITKEESGFIEEQGLIQKDINKFVSQIAAKWYKEQLEP